MDIAFLGLGHMGYHMAHNLVNAGYSVTGFDVVQELTDKAAEIGVTPADSAAAAVAHADVVITMFPAGEHVLDAYGQPGDGAGILDAAQPNTLFIDSSTIAVAQSREAAQRAHDAGYRAMDAPVSGGVPGAEKGTLTFMMGGPVEHIEAGRELLEVMGQRLVHCGDNGNGQAAKLCNNMLLAITTIGAGEAFTLGQNLGLTNEVLYDVMSTSTAKSWSVNTNCPVPGPVPESPASNDYQAGFAVSLMAKDLGLVQAAIDETNTAARFGEAARKAYQEYDTEENIGKDFSAIIRKIQQNQPKDS